MKSNIQKKKTNCKKNASIYRKMVMISGGSGDIDGRCFLLFCSFKRRNTWSRLTLVHQNYPLEELH